MGGCVRACVRACVCVNVCVCVCVQCVYLFFIILYVNCFGRTMLYMCIKYIILGEHVSCERSPR